MLSTLLAENSRSFLAVILLILCILYSLLLGSIKSFVCSFERSEKTLLKLYIDQLCMEEQHQRSMPDPWNSLSLCRHRCNRKGLFQGVKPRVSAASICVVDNERTGRREPLHSSDAREAARHGDIEEAYPRIKRGTVERIVVARCC